MYIAAGFQLDRRDFFGAAAVAIAAAGFGANGAAQASADASFGPLKQIDAGLLNIGYAEAGPADGAPVILLHGWPYDIHSYVDVAPLLASRPGYRVIVPLPARLRDDTLSFRRHG